MKTFQEVFQKPKPIIGVLHLKGSSTDDIRERAKMEIELYAQGGVDGILAENYFGTYDELVWALDYLRSLDLQAAVGVNCLNFDSLNFRLAREFDCDFMQLDSVAGHVKPRDEASLNAFFTEELAKTEALVLGGVRFKYQPVLSEKSLEEDLQSALTRCGAVCVTGDATGKQTPLEKLKTFRSLLGDFPLLVCSGLTAQNCAEQLQIADGAVVGSFFKDSGKDSGDVSAKNIRALMDVVSTLT